MDSKEAGRYEEYALLSARIRRRILTLIFEAQAPHIGSAFSCVELLVGLYFRVLNISRNGPRNGRDRFILSKGHACPALYVVLNERGFLDDRILDGFGRDAGSLELHPARNPELGIEVSTGSLGHGLSVGAGLALAAKKDNTDCTVYVLLGDGELNEGSVWEAAMFAAHHRLDNLVAIVDHNKMQALGRGADILDPGSLSDKFSAFGWDSTEIDGHAFDEIFHAFAKPRLSRHARRPRAIIAHTVKGKGVSFMEESLLWHYRAPDKNEYQRALAELAV